MINNQYFKYIFTAAVIRQSNLLLKTLEAILLKNSLQFNNILMTCDTIK